MRSIPALWAYCTAYAMADARAQACGTEVSRLFSNAYRPTKRRDDCLWKTKIVPRFEREGVWQSRQQPLLPSRNEIALGAGTAA